MATGNYCTEVRDLFFTPAHAGEIDPAAGRVVRGEAEALDRTAWVVFAALCRDGQVIEARFRAWGCPHLLAACELTAAQLEGRSVAELARFSLADLAGRLQVPAEKLGRLLVIEDALLALAASIRSSG